MAQNKAEDKIVRSLGAKLRQIRERKGWTLEETEEHGWTSWRHLQRIESGKNVTLTTLYRLTRLYGISLEYLFKDI
jgi:transcriptional regulator with XRE-family HTH domain